MSTDPDATPSTRISAAPSSAAPPSPAAPPSSAVHGRKFKHRELELADGGKLVLRADGSISQLDGDGTQTDAWAPADAGWASRAIRFGLFPQDATVPPTGRYADDRRPPRR